MQPDPWYDWADDDWDDPWDDDGWDDDEICPYCYSAALERESLEGGLVSITCTTCFSVWHDVEYYDESWDSDESWESQQQLVAQENKTISTEDIIIKESTLHGRGLFATRDLPKGYDVGTLSLIFDNWFLDTSYGRYINHSPDPNVELYHVPAGDHIKVGGRLNRAVRAGTELTADYADPLAPKPNFIAIR